MSLADDYIAWVESYGKRVCPDGCMPTPGQEREIALFSRVARALQELDRPMMKCAACGKAGRSAGTLEAMEAEFYKLHPGKPFTPDKVAIICDDCHKIEIKLGLVDKGTVQ